MLNIIQCIARKVPELCKSYTPGKSDQDIHVRLARLEQIIETALPHYWSQGNSTPVSDGPGLHDKHRSVSPMDDGNRSQAEDEDPSGGMFESGTWYGKSASGLVAAPAVLEQVCVSVGQPSVFARPDRYGVKLQSMVPTPTNGASPSGRAFSGSQSHSIFLQEELKPNLAPMEQSASERLRQLMQDCGYSTDRLQNMFDEVPPRKLRDELVDYYFDVMSVSSLLQLDSY